MASRHVCTGVLADDGSILEDFSLRSGEEEKKQRMEGCGSGWNEGEREMAGNVSGGVLWLFNGIVRM